MRIIIKKSGGPLAFQETVFDGEISDIPEGLREFAEITISDIMTRTPERGTSRPDACQYQVLVDGAGVTLSESGLSPDALECLDDLAALR